MNITQRHAVLSMCHRMLDIIRTTTWEYCFTAQEPLTEEQLTETWVISLRTLADALEKVRGGQDDEAVVRILRESFSFHCVDVDVAGEKRG